MPSRKKRQRSLTFSRNTLQHIPIYVYSFHCSRFVRITVMYLLVIYVYHISIVKLISNNYIGIKIEFSLRVVYTSYAREELENWQ